MSYKTGPRIVTDGLVLCLDAADQNSFFGYWSPVLSNGANAFDGSLSTAAGVLGGTNGPFVYSFANPPKITSARMYVFLGATSTQVGSNTGLILVNGVDVTQKVKDAGFYTSAGWVDVTNEAKDNWSTFQFKTVAGVTNFGIYAIEVNGRVLVGNYDGTTWNDVSGNGRHYTVDTNYVTYNSSKYFDVAFNSTAYNFIGPASNSFGFNSNMEHTIFCLLDIGNTWASSFFGWQATPNVGTDSRAIFTHFPWGNALYYDVGGCCGGTQRLSSSTLGATLTSGGFFNATWRTRTQSTPVKHIFKNGQVVLSGHTSTATMTWDLTGAAGIANRWGGKIANFIVYNRALSDDEITQNFQATRGRFGL